MYPEACGADRRRGLNTAYRQRAVRIATHLAENGVIRAQDVAAAISDPAARDVLYRNVHGWFSRPGRGVYGLTNEGVLGLSAWGPG